MPYVPPGVHKCALCTPGTSYSYICEIRPALRYLLHAVMMLLPVLLFFSLHLALYHSSVESCPRVIGLSDNSTLMGVCPNNGSVRVIPVKRTQEYECSFVRVTNHHFFWIINETRYNYNPPNPVVNISISPNLIGGSALRFTPQGASTTYIQCILCNIAASCFLSNLPDNPPEDYISTQPVQITAFSK